MIQVAPLTFVILLGLANLTLLYRFRPRKPKPGTDWEFWDNSKYKMVNGKAYIRDKKP